MGIATYIFILYTSIIAYINSKLNPNKIDNLYIYSEKMDTYYKYKWYHLYIYIVPWLHYNMVVNVGLMYYVTRCAIYKLHNDQFYLETNAKFKRLLYDPTITDHKITDPKIVLARILNKRNMKLEQPCNLSKCLIIKGKIALTKTFNLLIDEKNVHCENGMERYAKYFLLLQSDIEPFDLNKIKYTIDWSY